MEDSGLCALALARALKVFTGDAMLPTRLWVKMDELRSQGARGRRIVQLRTSEGATTRWATKGRLRKVTSWVSSRFVLFTAAN